MLFHFILFFSLRSWCWRPVTAGQLRWWEVLQSSLTQTPNYSPGKYMAVALLHHRPPTSQPAQIVRDTSAFLIALMGPKPMPASFQRPWRYQTTSLISVTANACLCCCKLVSVQLWKTLLCITRCLAGGHRDAKNSGISGEPPSLLDNLSVSLNLNSLKIQLQLLNLSQWLYRVISYASVML